MCCVNKKRLKRERERVCVCLWCKNEIERRESVCLWYRYEKIERERVREKQRKRVMSK